MKHYYFKSLTNWQSKDGSEKKIILWFTYGGRKRGKADFKFFDDEIQAFQYCKNLKMIMN